MYQYTSCGLDNIYLKNGFEVSDASEGKGIAIHDIDTLHRVIAKGIVDQPAPISGKEFRFLRIELDLSQKAIGDLMDKTDQMIAKWEKGANNIPVLADKAIRDLYMDSIGESHIADFLTILKDLDNEIHEIKFQLSETEGGWKLDHCA